MKRAVLFFILIVILTGCDSSKKSAIKHKRKYADILITIDMKTGERQLSLRKIGGSTSEVIPYYSKDNRYRVRTGRNIDLYLKNYNPVLYTIEKQISNEEIEINDHSLPAFHAATLTASGRKEEDSKQDTTPTEQKETKEEKALKNQIENFEIKAFAPNLNDNVNFSKSLEDAIKKSNNDVLSNVVAEKGNDDFYTALLNGIKEKLLIYNGLKEDLNSKYAEYKKTDKELKDVDECKKDLAQAGLSTETEFIKTNVETIIHSYINSTVTHENFQKYYTDKQKRERELFKEFNELLDSFTESANNVNEISQALQIVEPILNPKQQRFSQLVDSISIINKGVKKEELSTDSKKAEIKKLHEAFLDTKWDIKVNDTWRLYDQIRLAKYEQVIQLGQSDLDLTTAAVNFYSMSYMGNKIEKTPNENLSFSYNFRCSGGAKVTASVGFAFSSFFKNQKNFVKKNIVDPQTKLPGDTLQIASEPGNSVIPVYVNMLHVQWKTSKDISPALSFGLGIPLVEPKEFQFFLGGSVIWGKFPRWIFTGGFSTGKTNKLGGGYKEGERILPDQDIPIVKNNYAIGSFVSVTFNIAGQQTGKKK